MMMMLLSWFAGGLGVLKEKLQALSDKEGRLTVHQLLLALKHFGCTGVTHQDLAAVPGVLTAAAAEPAAAVAESERGEPAAAVASMSCGGAAGDYQQQQGVGQEGELNRGAGRVGAGLVVPVGVEAGDAGVGGQLADGRVLLERLMQAAVSMGAVAGQRKR